jgi:hypothetical protein
MTADSGSENNDDISDAVSDLEDKKVRLNVFDEIYFCSLFVSDIQKHLRQRPCPQKAFQIKGPPGRTSALPHNPN